MPTDQSNTPAGLPQEELPSGWHRHINPDGTPGGLIENSASVAPAVYVSPEAIVQGNSRIEDTSQVTGPAQVINATVSDGAIIEGQAVAIGGEYRGETISEEVVIRSGGTNQPHSHS